MEKREEASFEKAFEWAVIDNFNEEMNSLPSVHELEEQYAFSSGFEKKMQRLFRTEKRRKIIFAAQKFARRTATAAAMALVIFAAAFAVSPKVRSFVREMVLDFFTEYVAFTSPRNNTLAPSKLEPQYIPEGFTETERGYNDILFYSTYVNNTGSVIRFSSVPAGGGMATNNENVEYEKIEHDNIVYHCFKSLIKENESYIVWEYKGYVYDVSGLIEIKQLKNMAFSLKQS